MTSKSRSAGPPPPQYIESRSDNPVLLPLTQPSFSRSVTAASNYDQLNRPPATPMGPNVFTDYGLPDTALTESAIFEREKSFGRDPAGRYIPRLIVNDSVINTPTPRTSSTYPASNRTTRAPAPNKLPTTSINQQLPSRAQLQTASTEMAKQRRRPQGPSATYEKESGNGYWKTGTLFNSKGIVAIGPIVYDENSYAGPFGLSRTGSYIFYVGMAVFILLAGIFLIMTAIFYSQKYPDSTRTTGTLAGVGICAFALYLGIQVVLVGLWHQTYQREHPKKRIPRTKPRLVYTPFGYYLYPQYFADVNEQIHMQGYGTAKPDQNAKTNLPSKPVEIRPVNQQSPKMGPSLDVIEKPILLAKPELYFIQSVPVIDEQLPSVEGTAAGKSGSVEATGRTKQTVGKTVNDTNALTKSTKGTKLADAKPSASPSTDRPGQVSIARQPTTSQITLQPYERPVGDLRIEDINGMDHGMKNKKNKISLASPPTNAFYDDD